MSNGISRWEPFGFLIWRHYLMVAVEGRSFENFKLFWNSHMLTEFPPFPPQIPAPYTTAGYSWKSWQVDQFTSQSHCMWLREVSLRILTGIYIFFTGKDGWATGTKNHTTKQWGWYWVDLYDYAVLLARRLPFKQ